MKSEIILCALSKIECCLQAVLEQKVNDLHSNQIKLKLLRETCGEPAKTFASLILQDLFLPSENLISFVSAIQKLEHFPRTFLLQPEVVVVNLYVHKKYFTVIF